MIDKRRKTDRLPRVSPQLAARRAAAVRASWSEEIRRERREAVTLAAGESEDEG
jgi:hypothetical protein